MEAWSPRIIFQSPRYGSESLSPIPQKAFCSNIRHERPFHDRSKRDTAGAVARKLSFPKLSPEFMGRIRPFALTGRYQ
jgi:hypothetical protein